MKRLFVFTLLLCLPLGLMAQTQHIRFRHSGEFASFSATPDQFSSFSLTVSRSANNNSTPTATLQYTAVTVAADFNSETFTQIVGAIPATAFTGTSTRDLVLNLDTSTLDPSTSISQSCTIDFSTFLETCGPAPTGLIQLEFQENGVQRTKVLALNEEIFNGSTTTHIHQTSDNSTANVSGTILGLPVSGTNAQVGVNKDSSLEVIKN